MWDLIVSVPDHCLSFYFAYVQWARRHFIWRCVDWNRVSFSGETRLAISNAGGKTHKQALLELLRVGKGSIWWGAVSLFGVEKMGDQKTYFIVMQDNFNVLRQRRLVTSCHTISPLFIHKNWRDIWNKFKQNKKSIECNVFFCVC